MRASSTSRPTVLGASLLVALAAVTGCEGQSSESSRSDSEMNAEHLALPANDPCRDVLAPLVQGLADGFPGTPAGARVTLTSETDILSYSVDFGYDIVLDNDSSSRCSVLSVRPNRDP